MLTLGQKNYFYNFNLNTQHLRHRLPGYLILFAAYAFVPQRQFLIKNRLRLRHSFTRLGILTLSMKLYIFKKTQIKTVLNAFL